MKSSILSTLFFLLYFTNDTFCQGGFTIVKENLDWYYNINGKVFKQYNLSASNDKRLYIDTTSIDSTGVYFDQLIFNSRSNLVYGYRLMKNICQIYSVNITSSKVEEEFNIQSSNIIYPEFFQESSIYVIDEKRDSESIWGDQLYQINLLNAEKKGIVDLKAITNGSEISDIIFSPDKQKILIQAGTTEAGVWDTENHIVYDITNDNVNYIFQEFKEEHPGGWYILPSITKNFYDINGEHIFVKINERKDKLQFFYVLDSNFNIIDKIFSKEYNICGYNFMNGKIISYNIRSSLENKQQIIIPYVLTYIFEKALHAIYHNQELSQALYDSEFRQLDYYQLSILKNMVFAKYNYAFDSEFYQAFFNLFEFYNSEEMRNSRTKDINKKLTYNDSQNLEKIRQALKRAELEKIHKQQN